ncbi:MAG: hypothetical protein JJE25_01415 [Bacteroidia bacterium]|nr:hypothetical protein [Bacteroidia bacterium]
MIFFLRFSKIGNANMCNERNTLYKIKIIILFMTLVASVQSSFCQSNNQKGNFLTRRMITSAGINYSLPEENIYSAAGMNFSPQLFLTTVYSDFSFSVETNFVVNYKMEDDKSEVSEKIFFQLPVMMNVNLGHLASKDFFNAFGFFAGAGWNIQYGESRTVNGFAWGAGFRFWMFEKSFTLRFIHFPGNEKLFSSGKIILIQMNLGKYLNNVKANNKVSNFMKPYNKK